jgi:hypothetical protein
MPNSIKLAAALLAFSVAACGQTPGQRALRPLRAARRRGRGCAREAVLRA